MDKKTGLHHKGDALFLHLFCVTAFFLICLPGIIRPVYAEVIINNFRTLGTNLDEETQTGENNKNATITSTGSIEASGTYAIRGGSEGWGINIENGGSVTNTATSPGDSAILFNVLGDGTGAPLGGSVINAGSVTSNGTGIKMGGGTVTNSATGTITSTNNAINATGTITITNIGTVTSTGGNGIEVRAGGTITNSGTIAGTGSNGIAIWGDGTITNSGFINGYQNGIISSGYITVDNYGAIAGDKTSGVYLTKGKVINHAGSKITLTDAGAASSAILFAGYGEVVNSGEIKGARGIHFGVAGKVINNAGGLITGTNGWGIIFGNSGELINYGTIEGTTGVTFNMYSAGDDTLDNSGTIIGTGGTAVDMGAGGDKVCLQRGSAITGNVNGGAGDDKIHLTGSGAITGGTLVNFETIEKNEVGTWTLGGNLSSGNKISILGGTLRINGAFTHETGATYVVGAGADGTMGKISAVTATLNSGPVVDTSTGVRGGKHTIVETDSGLTGTYSQLTATTNSDYIDAALSYDANNAYIELTSSFAEAALTENQQAVATTLDRTYNTASGDMLNVYGAISTLDGAAIRSAYDQMGGASHTAFAAVDIYRIASFYRNLFRQSSSISSGAFLTGAGNSLAMFAANTTSITDSAIPPATKGTDKDPLALWIRAYGASGDRTGDDIASRYDFTIGGTMAGIEHRFNPTIRTGVALGYSRTDVEMKDLRDASSEDSFQGALYGSYTSVDGKWYIDTAAGYSINAYDTKRHLAFGTMNRVARGSYDGSDISGYIESGYLLPVLAFDITPYASFLALESRRDGFTENGAGALNLDGDSETTTSLQGSLGIRVAKEFTIARVLSLAPGLSARWIHEFGDTRALLNARFAGAPSGSFTVSSDTYDRDSCAFSLGVTGKAGTAWGFFLIYDAQMRSREFAHAVMTGARFSW